MKRLIASAMLWWTACTPMRQNAPAAAAGVELGHGWQRISDPATLGYSRAGLDSALALAKTMKTSAFMVAVGGRSLLEHGDLTDTSYIASARGYVTQLISLPGSSPT